MLLPDSVFILSLIVLRVRDIDAAREPAGANTSVCRYRAGPAFYDGGSDESSLKRLPVT